MGTMPELRVDLDTFSYEYQRVVQELEYQIKEVSIFEPASRHKEKNTEQQRTVFQRDCVCHLQNKGDERLCAP